MILILFTLVVVLLSSVSGISSEQRNDVGHPIISLLNASASVTVSHVQVTLQSQEPSSNTDQVFEISPGAKSNETVPQSTSGTGIGSHGVIRPDSVNRKPAEQTQLATSLPLFNYNGDHFGIPVSGLFSTTAQSSQTATTPPLINDSTLTPSSGTYSAVIGTETAGRKTTLTDIPITPSLGAESTELPALILGSHTIKADDQNEYTLVDGQTPTPSSTTTPGSDRPTRFIALPALSTQSLLVFDSSSSQLSLSAATSAVSKIPPLLALNGQNITANSLGQYNINGHTLTPGAVATVSGTIIALAPKASDNVAANRIKALSANTTTGSRSGPVGTSVQVFKGGVLGARDGLWSSSIALLVGIAVLLWL